MIIDFYEKLFDTVIAKKIIPRSFEWDCSREFEIWKVNELKYVMYVSKFYVLVSQGNLYLS